MVSVHGYEGDKNQIQELLLAYEHHECPVVILSPTDSQIHGIGPHICRVGGLRAYTGQKSLDRQWAQMKILLEYPFDFYLMNDSDSFLITKEIPQYLYDRSDTFFSNEVDDFRVTMPQFGPNFHKPLPQLAYQPPYFMSRITLERLVAVSHKIIACPTCPFIDWGMVQVCYEAGVKHARFHLCASCENSTPLGKAVMRQQVSEHQAQFIHSVKTGEVMRDLVNLYHSTWDRR